MRPAPCIRSGVLACVGLALSACGHSAPTRFLTLDALPPASAAAAAYAGPSVRIDSVRIPAELDRPELVRELGANRLEVDDFDHWGAPLGQLMRTALTRDLLARLPAGRVVFPDAPGLPATIEVDVDVLALSEAAGRLSMDVSWTTSRLAEHGAASGPVPLSHDLRLSTSAPATGAADHAAALSALLAQLADAIALQLTAAPPA